MTSAGIARVRACFEAMEEIFPAGDDLTVENGGQSTRVRNLPHMPQLPQLPQTRSQVSRALTLEEDLFEERAAIIEYDGGLPRALAEFLASRPQGP